MWALCLCVCTHARVCVCQRAGVFLGSLVTGQAVSPSLGVCLTLAGGAGVLKGPLICSDRPGCPGPGEGCGLRSGCSRSPRRGPRGRGPPAGRGGVGVGVGTREKEGPAGGAGGSESESAGAPAAGLAAGAAGRAQLPAVGLHRGWGGNHGLPQPGGLPATLPARVTPAPRPSPGNPGRQARGCPGSQAASLWGAGEVLAWGLGAPGQAGWGEPSPPWQPRRGRRAGQGPCSPGPRKAG